MKFSPQTIWVGLQSTMGSIPISGQCLSIYVAPASGFSYLELPSENKAQFQQSFEEEMKTDSRCQAAIRNPSHEFYRKRSRGQSTLGDSR